MFVNNEKSNKDISSDESASVLSGDEKSEKITPPKNVPGKKENKKSAAKWTNSNISLLIEEYEARPCLWDVFSEEYHNREVTGKAKQELKEINPFSGDSVDAMAEWKWKLIQ